MKVVLSWILSSYFILFNYTGVSASGGSNQKTQFELKLDDRSETNNYGYAKTSLDGLEAHMMYVKSGSEVSKVLDGSNEVWQKGTDEKKCLALLLARKDNENKLLMLLILGKISLTSNPLEPMFLKNTNGRWEDIDKDGFYTELGSLRPNQANPNYEEVDLTGQGGVELVGSSGSPIGGYGVKLFLPGDGGRMGKIKGTADIWARDSSKEEYLLYFVHGKKSSDRQFGLGVMRKNNNYEEIMFILDNSQWKSVDFSALKGYLTKDVLSSKLRGNGSSGKNGQNGSNGKNGSS